MTVEDGGDHDCEVATFRTSKNTMTAVSPTYKAHPVFSPNIAQSIAKPTVITTINPERLVCTILLQL